MTYEGAVKKNFLKGLFILQIKSTFAPPLEKGVF
jgi:hypothetical protein